MSHHGLLQQCDLLSQLRLLFLIRILEPLILEFEGIDLGILHFQESLQFLDLTSHQATLILLAAPQVLYLTVRELVHVLTQSGQFLLLQSIDLSHLPHQLQVLLLQALDLVVTFLLRSEHLLHQVIVISKQLLIMSLQTLILLVAQLHLPLMVLLQFID